MKLHAEIQPLASVLRIFKENEGYSDPYCFSATLKWDTPTEVEVLGTLIAPSPDMWRAIREACIKQGAKRIYYRRFKNDKEEIVDVPMPKK